jgi:hypothetical protein
MGGTCSMRGEIFLYIHTHTHIILVEKSEGRIPLQRPRHRWRENVNMDFRAVDYEEVNCIMWPMIGSTNGLL